MFLYVAACVDQKKIMKTIIKKSKGFFESKSYRGRGLWSIQKINKNVALSSADRPEDGNVAVIHTVY